MRDKYYDPDGWKRCTLRRNIELGQRLWLLCSTCRKSRYLDTAPWAEQHGVDLDTPFKTLGKTIRCRRCGTREVSVRAEPYSNFDPQPRQRSADGPVCPACKSDDLHKWPLRLTDYPPGYESYFRSRPLMITCGCEQCDNWWTQPEGLKLTDA